ncbi:hypothetical protein V6N13_054806 [Hibiscus sabdariffa]
MTLLPPDPPIPPKLHWSGLRRVFGRQGDIVDSFIARKLDKTGKRFGFVRFSNRVDADRAIERLNGFRLLVAKAKFQEIPSKGKQEAEVRTNNRKTAGPEAGGSRSGGSDGSNHILEKRVRNIQGHVEEEALWRLGKCLVGMMASPCSTKQVEDKLTKWGLGEIAVINMGGRCFLLEVKDQELFSLLEEQNWSLLKKVFAEIEKWSESFHLPERITWIQITGIPVHCWNYITFKRIAELVGTLLSLGENATGFGGCEKVNLLISTKQFKKIGETIELEVGRDIFMVCVEELGLYDQGIRYQNQGAKYRPCKEIDSESGDSSSGYSKAGQSKNREYKEQNPKVVEDEAIKSINIEIREKDDTTINDLHDSRKIGETEMVGTSINNDERDMDNNQHVLSEDIPNENGQELEKLNMIVMAGHLGHLLWKLGQNLKGLG